MKYLKTYNIFESLELNGNMYKSFSLPYWLTGDGSDYDLWLSSHQKITPTIEDISLIKKMEPDEYVTELVYMRNDGYEISIKNNLEDISLFYEVYIRMVSPDRNITLLKFEDEYWTAAIRSDNNNNHYLIDGIDGIKQFLKDI